MFEWAYERSCVRYAAVRQSIGEPDPFRLRHRERLGQVIAAVVAGGLDKKAAAALVQREAKQIPDVSQQQRFVILAETELTSLHPGNFARYRLSPAQFAAWQRQWR